MWKTEAAGLVRVEERFENAASLPLKMAEGRREMQDAGPLGAAKGEGTHCPQQEHEIWGLAQ